jgi:hypothetical protein
MKKYLSIGFVTMIVLFGFVFLGLQSSLATVDAKIWVCHYESNTPNLLNISENGWNGHNGHTNDFIVSNYTEGYQCPPLENNVTFTLTYQADSNGSISGSSTQQGILANGNGTAVTANANTGYHFVNWSDASTANPRTDSNVTANITVTANFAKNEEVSKTATLHAQKIVCDDESDLPNWGAGGPDITSTTASDWLTANSEKGCKLKDWNFEWGYSTTGDPDDNTPGTAGAGWTAFSAGTAVVDISNDSQLRVREIYDSNYIPFTGQNTNQNVSAEMYCSNDVLHYDNWEIFSATENTDYYCVAWNVPKEKEIQACRVDVASQAGDQGEGNGNAVTAWIHPVWTTALNSVATWIWDSYNVNPLNLTTDESKTFTKSFYVDGPVNDAVLKLAADNRYWVTINGVSVASSTGEFNYTSVTGPIDVKSFVTTGTNTIEIKIENIANGNLNPEQNPAAGIYELVINPDEQTNCSPYIPPTIYQCSDDVDNDKDGKTDMQDPGCSSPTDDDETDPKTELFTLIYIAGPNGTTTGSTTQSLPENGTTTLVTAVPDDGYRFVNWSDGSTSTTRTDVVGTSSVTFTANFAKDNDNPEIVTPNPTPTSNRSSGGRKRVVIPTGLVLGASTELPNGCGMYLTSYIKRGKPNISADVIKLQTFLNEELGKKLPLTGFYGPLTESAVREFQLKYTDDVLVPWVNAKFLKNRDEATGYVYKTTQRKINLIKCLTLDIPMPELK